MQRFIKLFNNQVNVVSLSRLHHFRLQYDVPKMQPSIPKEDNFIMDQIMEANRRRSLGLHNIPHTADMSLSTENKVETK
jgi:hypothetical protein